MKILYLLFMITISSLTFANQPRCPQTHCSRISKDLNAACIGAGFAKRPFPVLRENSSLCYCPCSCVAEGTWFQLPGDEWADTQELPIVQSLYNPFTKLKSDNYRATRSDVTGYQITKVSFTNHASIAVSENHTFILPSERTITAIELKPGYKIMTAEGGVAMVSSIEKEAYTGYLYNAIINEASSEAIDHVISTNGLMSGDLLLQSASDLLNTGIYLRTNPIETYMEEKK